MKKTIVTIIFVLSVFGSAFAGDGDLPNGGKSCQNNQTCIVSQTEQTPINDDSKSIYSIIKSFLDLF